VALCSTSRTVTTKRLASIPARVFNLKIVTLSQQKQFPTYNFAPRYYSEGPAPLTQAQIEVRIIKLLSDFDKVDKTKVDISLKC